MTTQGSGVLTPAHIPYLPGTDCGSCHSEQLCGRRLRAHEHDAAKHAFVATTCDTCHEAGLSSTWAPRAPHCRGGRPITPADPAAGDRRLQPLPHHGELEQHRAAGRSHAQSRQSGLRRVPHPSGADRLLRARWRAMPCCIPASPPAARNVMAATAAADLLQQQRQPEGRGARAGPHPAILRHRLQQLPCHSSTYAVGTFGPMNMTQATHAGVGTHLQYVPRGRPVSFYMGAASPGLQGRPADHTTGQMVAPNDCSICHTTANWNSTALPAGHMPNPANQACSACHTAAPSDYTTRRWPRIRCCTPASASAAGSATAVPRRSPGTTTSRPRMRCWRRRTSRIWPAPTAAPATSSNYAVGSFGPMNMTQPSTPSWPPPATPVMRRGFRFYMGAASPALQGRPADHTAGQMVAPNDCSLCHTTANWNSTALPAGHMPNPANQACTVCHTTAPDDYSTTTLAANAVLHTGITSGCITCHGGPIAAPPAFYNNYTPKDAVLSPVHIPTARRPASDCHSTRYSLPSAAPRMSSAKHTAMFTSSADLRRLPQPRRAGADVLRRQQSADAAQRSQQRQQKDCRLQPVPQSEQLGWRRTGACGSVARHALPRRHARSRPPRRHRSSPARYGAVRARWVRAHRARSQERCSLQSYRHRQRLRQLSQRRYRHRQGPAHIASDQRCENCHTTLAWLPARFDHQSIAAVRPRCCAPVTTRCRPWVRASIMCPRPRIARPATARSPGIRRSSRHSNVSGTCHSCHNSVIADGKTARHVSTTLDCVSCHSTSSWYARPTTATPAVRRSNGPVPPANRPRRDPDR